MWNLEADYSRQNEHGPFDNKLTALVQTIHRWLREQAHSAQEPAKTSQIISPIYCLNTSLIKNVNTPNKKIHRSLLDDKQMKQLEWRYGDKTSVLFLHLDNNFLLEKTQNDCMSLRPQRRSRATLRHPGQYRSFGNEGGDDPEVKFNLAEAYHGPLIFNIFYRYCLSCLTVLYSFHVLWKSTLPSSLRWMTIHPPPAVSMLQYTYQSDTRSQGREGKQHIYEGHGTLRAPLGLCICFFQDSEDAI